MKPCPRCTAVDYTVKEVNCLVCGGRRVVPDDYDYVYLSTSSLTGLPVYDPKWIDKVPEELMIRIIEEWPYRFELRIVHLYRDAIQRLQIFERLYAGETSDDTSTYG